MSLVVKGPGLKQRGAEKAYLGDLAADAVDLNPVAHVNAILADEDEPAEKGENEVLQGDGERGGGEAENRGRLLSACQR